LSQYDLWLISEKNGLKQSWPMFSGQNINIYAKALDTGISYNMLVRE
jgi:phage terminase large subunit GpA-like protein